MVLVDCWEMIVVGDGRFTLFRLVFVLNIGDSVNKLGFAWYQMVF